MTARATEPRPGGLAALRRGQRLAQLDGLRGLAVLLVLGFHVSGQVLPGGFLGVDLFLVLSGFLITGILLRQRDRGGVRYRAFYARRARRLLPTLVLVSVATLLVVAVLRPVGDSPEQAERTVWGALAGLAYVANVVLAVEGAGSLGLMGHTWSLSVEEHFYLLWPVVLIGLAVLAARRRRPLVVPVSALLGVALLWPPLLLATGSSTDRVYFGTDTRAYCLLVGCLLAVVLHDEALRARAARALRPAAAVVALVVLLGLALVLDREGGAYYAGAGPLVALCGAVLVGALVLRPTCAAACLLQSRALVTLGAWSYALYLWHYPLFLPAYDLLGSATEAERTTARAVAGLVALPLSWATHRWLERPVTERGLVALLPRGAA